MSLASQILTTLLTYTVVYKSTYHAKPRSIYFLPQYISVEFTVIRVLHHKLQYSTTIVYYIIQTNVYLDISYNSNNVD